MGSPGTHGARESSQLTWRPEGRDSHKQQGWDHRVDLGCSPAQTHSTRPASTATPQAALVGHREKVGVNPGKPTPKAAWPPPPTLIPGRCHVSGPGSGSGPLGSLAPPLRPQGPKPRRHQGAPGSRRRWRRRGMGRAGEYLLQKSRLGQGQLGEVPGPSLKVLSQAWEALSRRRPGTQGNNGNGREGEGARQTKALQAPPLASLPSSRCYSLVPSLPPRRLSSGSGAVGGRDRRRRHPHPQVWPCLPQLPS